MSPRVETPAFCRPLQVEEVPPEGLDLMISATEPERQALATADGLEGLAKLEASLHVAPWQKGGLAVTGEMRARIAQNCVVTLDPFETEIVEPIDVKFAPVVAGYERPPEVTASAARGRRRSAKSKQPPTPVVVFEGEDPPDPIVEGRVDLGALVAEFLALGLDPYPRRPGVEFEEIPGPAEPAESPFAKLQALKEKLPPRS